MTTTIYGEKYESTKGLRIAEVAKLIREDIKAAVKSGALPVGLKVSIQSETFSGGRAIRMSVTRLPNGFVLMNQERLAAEIENPIRFSPEPRFSPEAKALTEKLDAIVWAYNYDGSDTQSDYFHVRFYDGKAGFDYGLEVAEIAAFKADTIIEKLAAENTATLDLYVVQPGNDNVREMERSPAADADVKQCASCEEIENLRAAFFKAIDASNAAQNALIAARDAYLAAACSAEAAQ